MTHAGQDRRSNATPRLLVFGATGYTGQALVRQARMMDLEIHAHLRPSSPSASRLLPRFEALGACTHEVAWTDTTIAELVRQVEPTHIFALLGTTRKKAASAGPSASYASVDVGMTLMAFEAGCALEPPPRFVYLSAAGVGPAARGEYMQARWQVEQVVRDRSSNWVIAQPSFITGADREESRPSERVGAVLADAALSVAGAIGFDRTRDRWSSMTAAQLAQGLLHHALDASHDTRTVDAASLRAPIS